ncbi:MAG: hypothetical protein JNL88_00900 [Bacteroidia bacterium]|nr:hypothetical protein [Bacteroidia bacterium]
MKKDMERKQIGVWMDHAQAHFIHPATEGEKVTTESSDLESHLRFHGEGADGTLLGGFRSTNNEHHKHQREQEVMHRYFQSLQEKLMDYDEIFLFGPGTARVELHHLMKDNARFSDKRISLESADKMSENQMKAKVREHFSKESALGK